MRKIKRSFTLKIVGSFLLATMLYIFNQEATASTIKKTDTVTLRVSDRAPEHDIIYKFDDNSVTVHNGEKTGTYKFTKPQTIKDLKEIIKGTSEIDPSTLIINKKVPSNGGYKFVQQSDTNTVEFGGIYYRISTQQQKGSNRK